jgi:hypothetical protein
MASDASTSLPLILPATVAFAKPGPISAASSSIVKDELKSLEDLSGRVI